MSGETDNEITCPRCNELVPRKKFCGECSAPLAIVTKPTAPVNKVTDSEPHPPVQVSDSVPSTIESTIGSSKQEFSSNASNKTPVSVTSEVTGPVDTTSCAPIPVTNTSAVSSGGGGQQCSSTTTPTLYSVVLSQSDSGVKHTHQLTQQSGSSPPSTDSPDNNAASHSSSSPTTINGKDCNTRIDNKVMLFYYILL